MSQLLAYNDRVTYRHVAVKKLMVRSRETREEGIVMSFHYEKKRRKSGLEKVKKAFPTKIT